MNKSTLLVIKLLELLNSHYPYEHEEGDHSSDHFYNFKTIKNNKYTVHIYHQGDKATASFGHESGEEYKTHADNSEPGSSHKVFSTVKHIIKDHLKRNPYIKTLKFSANNAEPTRVRLYSKLVKSVAHNHTERDDTSDPGDHDSYSHHEFTIHTKDLK